MIAVHALTLLHHRQEVVSSPEIAQNACVNPAQVRRVMSQLVDAGLVCVTRGKLGGYRLAQNEITLAQIAAATATEFTKGPWYTGDRESEACFISAGMGTVAAQLHAQLKETIERQLSQITVADVEKTARENKTATTFAETATFAGGASHQQSNS